MSRTIVTFLSVFIAMMISGTASASPKLWVERKGGFFGREYVTDGQSKYPLHFFSSFKLDDLESKHPELSSKFEDRGATLTKAHVFYWVGLGTILSSVFAKDTGTAFTLIGGGFVVSMVGVHFGMKAREIDFEIINSINGIKTTANVEDVPSNAGLQSKVPSTKIPALVAEWTF